MLDLLPDGEFAAPFALKRKRNVLYPPGVMETPLLPLNDPPSTVRSAAPVAGLFMVAVSVAELITEPVGMPVKSNVLSEESVDGVLADIPCAELLTYHVLVRLKFGTDA